MKNQFINIKVSYYIFNLNDSKLETSFILTNSYSYNSFSFYSFNSIISFLSYIFYLKSSLILLSTAYNNLFLNLLAVIIDEILLVN
jgi:hypothetical protein